MAVKKTNETWFVVLSKKDMVKFSSNVFELSFTLTFHVNLVQTPFPLNFYILPPHAPLNPSNPSQPLKPLHIVTLVTLLQNNHLNEIPVHQVWLCVCVR